MFVEVPIPVYLIAVYVATYAFLIFTMFRSHRRSYNLGKKHGRELAESECEVKGSMDEYRDQLDQSYARYAKMAREANDLMTALGEERVRLGLDKERMRVPKVTFNLDPDQDGPEL